MRLPSLLRRVLIAILVTGAATPALALDLTPHLTPAHAPAPAATAATPPAAPAIGTAAPAMQITPLPLAPLASQISQTLQSLAGVPVASTAPAAPAMSSVPAGSSALTVLPVSVPVASVAVPAGSAALAPEAGEDTGGPGGSTFAGALFDTLTQIFATLKSDSAVFAGNVAALPDLFVWLGAQGSDPRRQALWSAVGHDILIVVGVPLLGSIALGLLLLPLRLRLRQKSPDYLWGRVGIVLGLLALRLTPLVLFLSMSLLLLDQNETHSLPRFVVLNLIYFLTAVYLTRQLLRAIFAPRTDRLRLVTLDSRRAFTACRWLTTFAAIIAASYFFTAVATAVHMPLKAIIIAQNIFGAVLTCMSVSAILRIRVRVAAMIRGKKPSEPPTLWRTTRQWLAQHWHILGIFYLVISFVVTLLGINNGTGLMLRDTILTIFILAMSGGAFLALDRWTTPGSGNNALLHRQVLSFLIKPFIWVFAVIGVASVWGFHIKNFIGTASGQRVMNAFITVALTLLILTIVYEAINSSIERYLNRRDPEGKQPVASARARTLLPMMRNTVFIFFSGIAILTALAAVGLNIAPVLAGAGVLGVAIGFGSQSLVKDFLTGLFIVIENSVAVGDVVTIGTFSGVVEALSVRTIRLRDGDGSLHILPFSEVSKITNMTRGFAYAMVDVQVSYDSDLDQIMAVMRDVGAKLQNDPLFKRVIEEPIEVFGIEKLNDSSITMRARIRTRPGKQWDVKRELLLQIIKRFAVENIEIPYPTVTHVPKAPVPPPEPIPVPASAASSSPAQASASPKS